MADLVQKRIAQEKNDEASRDKGGDLVASYSII